MVSALVLINTDFNVKENVTEILKRVTGVEEAHALYGVYDLLIKIKAPSIENIREITKLRIKPLTGVNSSLTIMIVQDD